MSRLGVVIPLYNHGLYIRETLESVLSQGDIVRRIIVVDDGSTDDSLAAASSIRDSRIKVIAQENAGAHAALNKGIALLEEECAHVAILNSDDRYLPGRLERCASLLDAHPRTSLVVTALEMIDAEGRRLPAGAPRAQWYQAARLLCSHQEMAMAARLGVANFAMTTSNIVARRQWLIMHPFRPYRYVHDYRCLLDAAFEDTMEVIDQPLLEYRVHASNTIDEGIERLVREMLVMHLELMADWSEAVQSDPAVRERFTGYMRMSWSNISSLRQDVACCLLAALAAKVREIEGDAILEAKVAGLPLSGFPELAVFPNKRLVHPDGKLLLGQDTSHLATQLDNEKIARKQEANRRRAAEQTCRLQDLALRSRWLAVGRLLGVTLHLDAVISSISAKPPDHSHFQPACRAWLKLGAMLGSKRSRKLLDLIQTPSPGGRRADHTPE